MSVAFPAPEGEVVLSPGGAGVSGTITHTPLAGGLNRVVIPASAGSMGNLASAPGFLWWDTGYTVEDLHERYSGARLSEVSLPAGTSADAVLGVALLFRASGTPDLSTDDFVWAQHTFGLGAADNTTANTVTRRGSNSIIPGTAVLSFSRSKFMTHLHPVGNARETIVGHFYGAAARNVHTTVDSQAISGTDKVYVVVALGRSDAEGSPVTVDFKTSFIPKDVGA